MPGWLKALLIIAIIAVLLVVGVVVGVVVWWSHNKDRVIGGIKESTTQGRDFGRNSDNQGCVDQALLRYKKDPGFTSAISTNLFTKACLDASRPTAGFCNDVPKVTEFIKSAEWRAAQCRRIDLAKDNYCPQLFQPQQEFCERGALKSAPESNSQ